MSKAKSGNERDVNPDLALLIRATLTLSTSLRANGSAQAPPDDRLREAIHRAAKEEWIASSLTLLAMTAIAASGRPSIRPQLRLDHVGGLLADHEGWRIGVAADQGRHDRGIDDAQAFNASDFQLRIDPRSRIDAHLAGADRVIDGIHTLAQNLPDIFVGFDALREQVRALQRFERGRVKQPPRRLETGHHGINVGIFAEEVRIDRRRSKRIGALQPDPAAALWPQHANMAGEAGAPARLAGVIVQHRHAEMQLDIGHVEVGASFEEAPAFGDVRGHRSATLAPVLRNSLENSRDAGKRQAGEIRRVRGEAEYKVRMILQVLSDAGQMMRGCDAVLRQRGVVADAGKHQQLRALKRAGGKDHFAAGADLPDILALAVLDADRALALEQDAGGLRLGLDAQIRARCHEWMDVAACRAPALAVVLGDLVGAEAFLLLGVEVFANPELRLARGLQIDLPHRIVGAQPGDMERAALAVILAVEFGIIFGAFEVGQHVGVGPAGVAKRRPLIIIAAMAADIDHRVDRGGTAEPLAARLIADPAVEAGLRHRIERPVVDLARDHQDHRARRGYHPVVALAAGFQQRHRRVRVIGKAARDRAAPGATAHHHKIECIRHACPPHVPWPQGWALAELLARVPGRLTWRK